MDAISAAETASAASYTRLHITPFNPDLLTTILPLSVLPHAQNISYHSLQTFPDKAYGFVDLPTMDAEKLKKKLHGSILKGAKVKIEKAREPVDLSFTAGEEEPKKVKKRKDLIKKRKRYDETIPAVEIGERSVKRGWTTPTAVIAKGRKEGKEKKVVLKSKYTTGPECLFKMVLPPNMASSSKSDKKGKEALLHEFSNTTKYATFLRGAAGVGKSKAVKEFVEGKGWVDEDGNVVEVVVKRVRKPGTQKMVITQDDGSNSDTPKESLSEGVNYGLVKEVISRKSFSPEKGAPADETSEDPDTSLDSSLEYSDSDNSEPSIPAVSIAEDSKTSTSGSSSESDFESSDNESTQPTPQPVPIFKTPLKPPILTTTSVRPPSSSGPGSALSITIPTPIQLSTPISAIHPLEALYKRPALSTSSQAQSKPTTFTFFDADSKISESPETETLTQTHYHVPLTPFTQKDFEFRGLRSSAPTPDTAHAGKRFMWPRESRSVSAEDIASPLSTEKGKGKNVERYSNANIGTSKEGKEGEVEEGEESEFQKWFYEHRGDTSRAWKKRRKTAAKEKRQRDNRRGRDQS